MVRATFAGFQTALTALQANSRKLDVTSQNLANMNVEGYTRQQLKTSSLNYENPVSFYMNENDVNVGYGVCMDGVIQIRDKFMDIQYRDQNTDTNYNSTIEYSLNTLAKFMDESNSDGIRASLDAIQKALTTMQDTSKVQDPVYEGQLQSDMSATTVLLNSAARQIKTAEDNEFEKLHGEGTSENGAVEAINTLLREIGDLNDKIKHNQLLGNSALELMDERNVKIDQLSGYIPISVEYYSETYEVDGQTRYRIYNYDKYGSVCGKSDWPEDLRITLDYTTKDSSGAVQNGSIILVNGTYRDENGKNYGSVALEDGYSKWTNTGTVTKAAGKYSSTDNIVKIEGEPTSTLENIKILGVTQLATSATYTSDKTFYSYDKYGNLTDDTARTTDRLSEIGFTDDQLSNLVINGTSITGLTSSSTIRELVEAVNNSSAGVTVSYSSGKFSFKTSNTGEGTAVTFNSTAEDMFGGIQIYTSKTFNTGSGVASATDKLSDIGWTDADIANIKLNGEIFSGLTEASTIQDLVDAINSKKSSTNISVSFDGGKFSFESTKANSNGVVKFDDTTQSLFDGSYSVTANVGTHTAGTDTIMYVDGTTSSSPIKSHSNTVDVDGMLVTVSDTFGSNTASEDAVTFEKVDTQPLDVQLKFSGYNKDHPSESKAVTKTTANSQSYKKDDTDPTGKKIVADGTIMMQGGSVQASLDMLALSNPAGTATEGLKQGTYYGYDYYMDELDNFARTLAREMNACNYMGNAYDYPDDYKDTSTGNYLTIDQMKEKAAAEVDGGATDYLLLVNRSKQTATATYNSVTKKYDGEITAENISLATDWINGNTKIGLEGSDSNQTILSMLKSFTQPHTEIGNKTYANYMNSLSTKLANDQENNKDTLDTNKTVLNSITSAKDQLSGVSLDEEAANMMTYVSSYNAAAKVITAFDETLQSLLALI